jgi:tetratricopeptide (TPR) repeat protein
MTGAGPATSPRLGMLEQLVVSKPSEPFPRYGLAMEYKKLERYDDAVAAFEQLIEVKPGYVPSYLMFGNLLEALGRAGEAASIYGAGIEAAQAAGDDHAIGELQAARDACS